MKYVEGNVLHITDVETLEEVVDAAITVGNEFYKHDTARIEAVYKNEDDGNHYMLIYYRSYQYGADLDVPFVAERCELKEVTRKEWVICK